MRRLLALSLASLAVAIAAAPAHACSDKARAWKKVLRAQQASEKSPRITLRARKLTRENVVVRLRARARNRRRVSFPDPLYGATAWSWNGRRWRRVDTADVRPAIIEELAPGKRARVRLPLMGRHHRVRVLVPTTPADTGRWVDVSRFRQG